IADGLGLDTAEGALVASVTEGDPADGAIEPGDIILAFDGRRITDARALSRAVADTRVGATVPVEIWRKGRRQTVQVTIAQLDESRELAARTVDEPKTGETLGMQLSTLTPELRQKFALEEDVEGVVVLAVDPNSSAAEQQIQPGDLITEVSQDPVATPEDLARQVSAVQESGRRSVVLTVMRGGELRFVAVRVENG
ncbi:MAG: PDZ domain-containing protein, partial [Alphaproteobacteria bacterium]|nr:PDZ domain-containing protein [Alphaproteobacteria bacterium]